MTDSDATEPGETAPAAAPPSDPRIGAGQSIALGCGGFVGFFALAAFLAGALSEGGVSMVAALLGVGVLALWGFTRLKRAGPHTRAVVVRLAIGFLIALLLFGGCLAIVASTNFH